MLAAQVILIFHLITSSLASPLKEKIEPFISAGDKYANLTVELNEECPNISLVHDEVHDRTQISPSEEFCDCLAHAMKCDALQSEDKFNPDEFDKCKSTLKHHGDGCEMPRQGMWSGRLYKHEHITVKDWMTCELLCQMELKGDCTGWDFGAKNDEDPSKKTCYLRAQNGELYTGQRNMVAGVVVDVPQG